MCQINLSQIDAIVSTELLRTHHDSSGCLLNKIFIYSVYSDQIQFLHGIEEKIVSHPLIIHIVRHVHTVYYLYILLAVLFFV